jgi:hypothetical protein
MLAGPRLGLVVLAGISAAYLVGGWLAAAVSALVVLLSYLGFCFALSRLPPRHCDQVHQIALCDALIRGFREHGMSEDEAAKAAAVATERTLGPWAGNDPEFIRWMVNRHGEQILAGFEPEVQAAYHRYWGKAPGEPRYPVLVRPRAATAEEDDRAPGWEIQETCADLPTVLTRHMQLSDAARRAGLQLIFAITALT